MRILLRGVWVTSFQACAVFTIGTNIAKRWRTPTRRLPLRSSAFSIRRRTLCGCVDELFRLTLAAPGPPTLAYGPYAANCAANSMIHRNGRMFPHACVDFLAPHLLIFDSY